MTNARSPRGAASVTMPLEELTLTERESVFHIPRAGDVALLGVLVAVLLGNGVWLWRQLGGDSGAGRAIFFGLLLLCVYWCGVVYTFKLSLAVCVSPRSISVVRGPWRVEIRWSDLARLMERVQPLDGRRYRWIIAQARDGRRISIREDAIGDYARFRREAYERYRMWRDHGGTWGATGSGPFAATEVVRDEAQWWCISALLVALPGIYFVTLLPATNPLGYALIAGSLICLGMLGRAFLQRQTYTVDRAAIETRTLLRRSKLAWLEVSKVERARHPVSGIILTGVAMGRMALRLASRGDAGIRTFAWSPRAPEYLILRGRGRQARIRLHRLMQPDELLAWIEFYEQVRRSTSGPRTRPTSARTTAPISEPLNEALVNATPDLSDPAGPLDPWGAGRQGEPVAPQSAQPAAPFAARMPTSSRLPDFTPPADGGFTRASFDHRVDQAVDHTEAPTMRTPIPAQDDAWLRESGAHASAAEEQESTARRPVTGSPGWQQPPTVRQTPPPFVLPTYQEPERTVETAGAQWSGNGWGEQPAAPYARPQTPPPPIFAEQNDEPEVYEEDMPTTELEAAPTPWRDERWQPPALPRFGPQGEAGAAWRHDDSSEQR